ncbi:MAG: molybdopterin cofactor-binding domain-containing protein [Sphingomicrobium sp.]
MSLKDRVKLDRRTLLIGGGLGVGLVVALTVPSWLRQSDQAGDRPLGAFIKIGRDGRVIVAVPQVETGQGVWTALPQIAADELGAAWDQVAVEPAPFDDRYANPLADKEGWFDGLGRLQRFEMDDAAARITAGSTSIRAFEQTMREAGAAARAMLIKAAASRWNVDDEDCDTADGKVTCGDHELSFAALAEDAAGYSPGAIKLRKAANRKLIGQPLQRLDSPAKTNGSFRFAGDVRLPDMVFASARVAPVGGKLNGYVRSKGVIAGNGWIAAVGDSWWSAEQALRSAQVQFDVPRTSVPLDAQLDDALASGATETWHSRGDYAAAVEGSRALTALYRAAPAMHLGLEPLTVTARWKGDVLEVWATAQAPELARAAAERVAGGARLAFYPMPAGEPGGRAMEQEGIPIAVALSRQLGRPVQLTFSAAVSQNHDLPSPAAVARMYGLPRPDGIPAAWKMRLVTAGGLGSALSRLAGGEAATVTPPSGGGAPPYGIANVKIDAVPVNLPYRAGYMRGSPEREIAFFSESFVDELARAAGVQPLAFRMAMLGSNPRLAACIQQATSAASWDGGGMGSTMGLAAWSAYGSHIALIAEATIGADSNLQVHRLVAAVDCGRVANQGLVRQQIQSGMLWALAQASVAGPEFLGPMPIARDFGRLSIPRINHVPAIRVDLIVNDHAPGGVSGLGVAVLAPAVANAIHAATGKRLRSLPFDAMAAA